MIRTCLLAGVLSWGLSHAGTIYYIYSTGQSLSRGRLGSPALNTTQPFTPPNVKVWPKFSNQGIDTGTFHPLVSNEPATLGGGGLDYEDPGPAMANTLRQLQGGNGAPAVLVDMHGVGGRCYSSLKRGATTTESYTAPAVTVYPFDDAVGNHFGTPPRDPANVLGRAKTLAANQGDSLAVVAMTVVHGECDFDAQVTAGTYAAYLVEWRTQFNQEASYIMGTPVAVPMFVSQHSSWGDSGRATPTTAAGVESTPIGTWIAARDNPSTIGVVTPHYIFSYANDGLHLVNTSYEKLGGYYAKALNKWLTQGKVWRPVAPRSITRDGNTYTVRFHVPTAPLVFDTTAVTNPGNYGFEVVDATGVSRSILSVALAQQGGVTDTVVITTTGAAADTDRIRYAYTAPCVIDDCSGPTNGARGNLRDSDATALQRTATALPNWSITFSEPVGFSWEPEVPAVAVSSAGFFVTGAAQITGKTQLQ